MSETQAVEYDPYRVEIEYWKERCKGTILSLENLDLGYMSSRAFFSVLKDNKTLEKIYIDNVTIDDSGAIEFAKLLERNKTIKTLFLYHCNIGDTGAEALARMLEVNTTLEDLSLGDNAICDNGVEALAESLKINTSLLELYLWANPFMDNSPGNKGAKALAEMLKVNKTLEVLDLKDTRIDDSGFRDLVDALKENKTLTGLFYNTHDGLEKYEDSRVEIVSLLERNKEIRWNRFVQECERKRATIHSALNQCGLQDVTNIVTYLSSNEDEESWFYETLILNKKFKSREEWMETNLKRYLSG